MPYPVHISIWTEKYDYRKDNVYDEDRRLDFPPIAPGKTGEVLITVGATRSDPIQVFWLSTAVWQDSVGSNTGLYLPFDKKILAGDFKGSRCFVLTACYGDHDAPTVLQYRQFRDHHLAKHKYGRKFISWYYTHGPKLADRVAQMPRKKAVLRQIFKAFAHLLPR